MTTPNRPGLSHRNNRGAFTDMHRKPTQVRWTISPRPPPPTREILRLTMQGPRPVEGVPTPQVHPLHGSKITAERPARPLLRDLEFLQVRDSRTDAFAGGGGWTAVFATAAAHGCCCWVTGYWRRAATAAQPTAPSPALWALALELWHAHWSVSIET
eukprot:gene18366-biopygen5414